ncbi:predicted protein [Sclerotinia sclerotiorum 1980 UF-70]|uniref:Uncharacterized protein n=1 Tax=Sclerotinia sclerotiorum (strain ATCC 18683 / 1980 / Ss-1) TaxID=665079 RepID=A7E8T4_SCLS1|nr:predicted protein [Sclerotinia sclerotiorum 1980 UF-70]EDN96786.1 predicted protein [Sclerotinia sclerotiorum 1980 UF-70]
MSFLGNLRLNVVSTAPGDTDIPLASVPTAILHNCIRLLASVESKRPAASHDEEGQGDENKHFSNPTSRNLEIY